MKNAKGELDEVMAIAGVLMVFDYDAEAVNSTDTNSTRPGGPSSRDDGNQTRER
jgi:hypothetical protein